MQSRRSKRLVPDLAPLTPSFPEPKPSTKLSEAQLQIELVNLRRLLRAERKRHAQLEGALGRYNALLEQIVTSQRQAFEQLHSELIPSVFPKGK